MTEKQEFREKPREGRLPPWMSEPGAPERPNFSAFSKTLNEMNSEKDKLLQRIKSLQNSVKSTGSAEGDDARAQRDALRNKINEIDALRKNERTIRLQKNEEISAVRKQKKEDSDKVKALEADLGGFTTVKEIDAAIEYMKRKMEFMGGGLEAEKKNNRRLHQLEEAKKLLQQLQPLQESIQKAEEREMKLEQEFREIHERLVALNKQHDEEFAKKKELDAKVNGRSEVYKECDVLRTQLNKIFEEIKRCKEEKQQKTEAWDAWCKTAKANYAAKMEAMTEERRKKEQDAENSKKMEKKLARAKQRQNPFSSEIGICESLVYYLKGKQESVEREKEKRAKALAAKSFDPHANAPEGCVVLHEGTSVHSPISGVKADKKIVVRHESDKVKMFEKISVKPPSDPSQLQKCVEEIEEKKKEYESHIKSGEPQLSSDEEEMMERPEEQADSPASQG